MRKNVLSFLLGLMLGMKLDTITIIIIAAIFYLLGLMTKVSWLVMSH